MSRHHRPTAGTRCHIVTDEPHNGSTDIRRYPPSMAELAEAYGVWRDPERTDTDLVALCGGEDRAGVMIAIVALHIVDRCEVRP